MKTTTKHPLPLIILLSISAAACGGGGGGSPLQSTQPRSFAEDNEQIEREIDEKEEIDEKVEREMNRVDAMPFNNALSQLEKHAASFRINEIIAITRGSQALPAGNAPIIDVSHEIDRGNFVATIDSGAANAWRLGWTGKGVKIGILDDFKKIDTPVYGSGVGAVERSHGEAVRFVTQQIAPEAITSSQQLSFGCGLPPGTQDREIAEAYEEFETGGFHIVNNSWSTSRNSGGDCAGNPGGLRNAETWRQFINYTIESEGYFRALALPIGSSESYDANMLFVFVAGNEGRECPYGTGDCNLYASSILKLRENEETKNAGDRVIFVGALADNRRILANYSDPAGRIKNDYIVAHDNIFSPAQGSGTSFAAPRVAGAAALVRQKFPGLNGPNLKQVLLVSADDLGAPGVDEVFGYGKLNIMSALSPIDGLTR